MFLVSVMFLYTAGRVRMNSPGMYFSSRELVRDLSASKRNTSSCAVLARKSNCKDCIFAGVLGPDNNRAWVASMYEHW